MRRLGSFNRSQVYHAPRAPVRPATLPREKRKHPLPFAEKFECRQHGSRREAAFERDEAALPARSRVGSLFVPAPPKPAAAMRARALRPPGLAAVQKHAGRHAPDLAHPARHVGREVGLAARLPIVVDAPITQRHHHEHAHHARNGKRRAEGGQGDERKRAAQARHRIEVALLEDARRLAHADVAQRATAHRRDAAEDDRYDEPLVAGERLAGAGEGEQPHRQRVGEKDRGVKVPEQPAEVEHERADDDADDDEVGMRGEVHAAILQEHVADDAAAVAGEQAEHHRADDVELAIARKQSAGQHTDDDGEVVDAPRNGEHPGVREKLLESAGVHGPREGRGRPLRPARL